MPVTATLSPLTDINFLPRIEKDNVTLFAKPSLY